MDKADTSGLGLAVLAHLALFAVLTLGIARRSPPPSVQPPAIDVQLVDEVGLQSAAPAPAQEAPQEQTAPDMGLPEEAPPAPAPVPKPAPRVAKTAPAPAPAPTPAKAVPRPMLTSDFMKDIKSAARAESKGATAGKSEHTTGSRLGPDFLKGIASPSVGKGTTARATITGAAMNGLAAAIKRQVQPCYELGALGGTPAMQIVTVLRLRFNRDGSVAGTPQVVEQTGVDGSNSGYRQQMADLSRRAVLRCAPLKLPVEMYEGGWEEIEMGFTPRQMQ